MSGVIALSTARTMSSLEIAKLTEKAHNDVLKDIRRILEEVGIGAGEFSRTYLTEQNKEMPCFHLPRRECDLIIAGYSAKYRLAIIDRWQELEAKFKTPQTFIEAMQLATQTLIENEALKVEVLALTDQRDDLQVELDQSMEWLSIKKVAAYNNLHWKQIPWLPLKRHGIQTGRTPHKVFDANFPDGVNVYHRESWAATYPHLIMPGEET
jgi:phage regulator Rha-like protein